MYISGTQWLTLGKITCGNGRIDLTGGPSLIITTAAFSSACQVRLNPSPALIVNGGSIAGTLIVLAGTPNITLNAGINSPLNIQSLAYVLHLFALRDLSSPAADFVLISSFCCGVQGNEIGRSDETIHSISYN